MASIVTAKDEFARWLAEWLRRMPKGGVFDIPPDQTTRAVNQQVPKSFPPLFRPKRVTSEMSRDLDSSLLIPHRERSEIGTSVAEKTSD